MYKNTYITEQPEKSILNEVVFLSFIHKKYCLLSSINSTEPRMSLTHTHSALVKVWIDLPL